ncbi:hypothetical protein ARMGADRAFT_1017522 [Armillaria gallica]|uniref:Uncharacterized protein n=1 Tax=Armillaria gallica TaxID=47427 RepID=A0A2H3D4G4_ARMGA|nr:hypothetical protein ARMGADRAFT_1017522 [Armillaria gallica]
MISYYVPFPFPSDEKPIPLTFEDDQFIFPQQLIPYYIPTFYSTSLPIAPALLSFFLPVAEGPSATDVSSLIQFLLKPNHHDHTTRFSASTLSVWLDPGV